MENFNKKIKTKKLEELQLEKKYLINLENKFMKDTTNINNKIKKLIQEKNVLDLKKKKINEIDTSSIELELSKNIKEKNTIINKNKNILFKNDTLFNQLYIEKENKLEIINKNRIEFINNKLHNKQYKEKIIKIIEIFNNKIIKIQTIIDNCNLELNKILSQIKSLKKNFKEHNKKNVLERHNMIQENLNNLILKKKIDTEIIKYKIKLLNEEELFGNLEYTRNNERIILKNEYMNNLNSENIIEEISKIDKTLLKFDNETIKQIFLSRNRITNLKKNIKRGKELFELKQSNKIFKKKRENREINKQINELICKKINITNKLSENDKDVIFLKQNISQERKSIVNFEKENKECENNFYIQLNNKIKDLNQQYEIDNKNHKLKKKILLEKNNNIQKEIDTLKDKYYELKRKNIENINEIKVKLNYIVNEILNYNNIIEKYKNIFKIDKEKLDNRIKYLEKKLQYLNE